jgi:uncharacterized protein (DUF1810 family)
VSDPYNLRRFVDAQDGIFGTALAELRAGNKQSHWMWFIFPQLAELGRSSTAKFYGLSGREEAAAYLAHPLLGSRLRDAVQAIIPWSDQRSAEQILGAIDAMKLRSCLTLFDAIEPRGLFADALAAFYDGPDEETLALLRGAR